MTRQQLRFRCLELAAGQSRSMMYIPPSQDDIINRAATYFDFVSGRAPSKPRPARPPKKKGRRS